MSQPNQIDAIYQFVKPYFKDYPSVDIKDALWMHYFYGTIDTVEVDGKIIAAVRWNISPSGRVCEVIDVVVSPGHRSIRLFKHLIARNWHRFPSVAYIRFRRHTKHPGRQSRLYSIYRILHVNKEVHPNG